MIAAETQPTEFNPTTMLVLPSPRWDQSLTGMSEANDFKGPTSGMGPSLQKRHVRATSALPLVATEERTSRDVSNVRQ